MEKKEVVFGFGTDQAHCEAYTFRTVEDLITYAQAAWDNNEAPFDEDKKDLIHVGTAETFSVSDFAPGLDDIADQITDRFYSEQNVDEYADAQIDKREEAEVAWREFVEKYFELPAGISITCKWFGVYDLKRHCWHERYEDFDEYAGQL